MGGKGEGGTKRGAEVKRIGSGYEAYEVMVMTLDSTVLDGCCRHGLTNCVGIAQFAWKVYILHWRER